MSRVIFVKSFYLWDTKDLREGDEERELIDLDFVREWVFAPYVPNVKLKRDRRYGEIDER
jgi:hypothetical protein